MFDITAEEVGVYSRGGRLFEDRGNMVLSLKYIVIVSEAIDPAILRKRLKPSVPQKSPN